MTRRVWKIIIQVGILGVIVVAVGTIGFVEYSAQPSFCTKCHNMVPYYESWASSSHNMVPCISCHYAPGIKAEAMGKLQAANQVVKYVTGTYGLKPWAEIEDAACLRSGCHITRELESTVVFKGIRFNHSAHLGELRRGKQLRCTSCHSQIVQGEHLTVTESTCYLCHFKERTASDPVGGCVGCHTAPPRVISPVGFAVDHADYVRDLVSCVSCHNNVIEGSGSAERSRCFNCHNEPERVGQFENTTRMHEVHIAEHNVECAQCHVPIEHRVVSHSGMFELDCASCHQRVHEEQQKLYAGIGGHGTDAMPSAMYLANVSCKGCHELSMTVRGHEQVSLAGEASCLSCHGTRYANILPRWQQEISRKVGRVERVVRDARAAIGAVPARRRPPVDSLLGLAAENVALVRTGKGAHNIAFADQVLRNAVGFVEEAVRAGPLSYRVPQVDLGPSVGANACLQCHLGMERRQVPFDGTSFDHEKHVLRGGFGCTACHTPLDEHGGTRISSRSQCNACHHAASAPIACARCHEGPGGAPAAPMSTATGGFPHAKHVDAGFSCATCHKPPSMTAAVECQDCHKAHHQPAATCSACHAEGVKAKHTRAMAHEMTCSQCHAKALPELGSWSRQICTTCHTNRVDHNAPLPCEGCHKQARAGPTVGAAAAGS